MTLVHIVYVPDAELRGPDTNRMGKLEDVPDELARMMIGDGSARVPTDEEIAAYHETQQVEEKSVDVADSAPSPPKTMKARDRQQTEPAAEVAP